MSGARCCRGCQAVLRYERLDRVIDPFGWRFQRHRRCDRAWTDRAIFSASGRSAFRLVPFSVIRGWDHLKLIYTPMLVIAHMCLGRLRIVPSECFDYSGDLLVLYVRLHTHTQRAATIGGFRGTFIFRKRQITWPRRNAGGG